MILFGKEIIHLCHNLLGNPEDCTMLEGFRVLEKGVGDPCRQLCRAVPCLTSREMTQCPAVLVALCYSLLWASLRFPLLDSPGLPGPPSWEEGLHYPARLVGTTTSRGCPISADQQETPLSLLKFWVRGKDARILRSLGGSVHLLRCKDEGQGWRGGWIVGSGRRHLEG